MGIQLCGRALRQILETARLQPLTPLKRELVPQDAWWKRRASESAHREHSRTW